MIIVDSSVWIDYFNGRDLPEVATLDRLLETEDNFRTLRKKGITVRKTIDVTIATFCIKHGHELLFSEKDFAPFVEHLGLISVKER